MLTVQNLRKSYDNIKAVDGLSFQVETSETFGLLGPNGAGKTTTINLLLGILKPDSGEVTIGDQSDPTRPEIRKLMGNAPQSVALYDELSAEENLKFFGQLYSLSSSYLKERVEFCLEFAALTDRRKDRVGTFSGGMKRRLNMACALVHDPPVILFDEPTVGVDPQSRNMIFDSIEKLKAEGRTILYTTHYMEEASRLCDRVAIIDKGQILTMGTIDNLIAEHGGLSIVEVEFESPPTPDQRAKLPGLGDGTNLRVETDNPIKTLAELSSHGPKLSRAVIDRADLESVFLNLTGRRLRD